MINHLLHVFIFSHTLPNLCHLPCFHVILSFLSPPACSSLLICHFLSSPSPDIIQYVSDSPPLPPPTPLRCPSNIPQPRRLLLLQSLISLRLSSPLPSPQYITLLLQDKRRTKEDDARVRERVREPSISMSLLSEKVFPKMGYPPLSQRLRSKQSDELFNSYTSNRMGHTSTWAVQLMTVLKHRC